MNTTSSLEAKAFNASQDDIKALVTQYMDAQGVITNARGTYLKVLLGTARAELGMKPRARTLHTAKRIGVAEIAPQEAALQAVHKRFYALFLAGARAKGLDAREVNKKTNFARSYKSTLRTWVRAGHSLEWLSPFDITREKIQLAARKPQAGRMPALLRTIDRRVRALALDAKSRRETANALIALAGELMKDAGAHGVRSSARAFAKHVPLITAQGVFLPVHARTEVRAN